MNTSSNGSSARSIELHPWLNDPRWSSSTLHAKEGKFWLQIKTLPGVIGGKFAASLSGMQAEFHGTASVTINCTTVKSSRDHEGRSSATIVDEFLEAEIIEVSGPQIDFEFAIPYEAICLTEGANWTLVVEFANGVSEPFEIPVYRTDESDPNLTTVKIASLHSAALDASKRPERLRHGPSYKLSVDDKLRLEVPAFVRGQPSLFKGLSIFAGLWGVVTVAFFFIFGKEDAPVFMFIPLLIMGLLLLFLRKGITAVEMDEDLLTVKHSLFGVGFPSKIKKEKVSGFSTKCIGALPSENGTQSAYLLGVYVDEKGFKILTPALLNQWDSRLLIKRFGEYWALNSE